MINIVLIGSRGQLGTDMQSVLSNSRYRILNINREQANLERPGSLTQSLKQLRNVDFVINCAALTNTEECEFNSEKAFQVNALAVLELAAFCRQNKVTLIHFSTDYVFDGRKKQPYQEADYTNPINVYGHSKLAAEKIIAKELDRFFVLRISSLFGRAGKSGTGKNFVETILGLTARGESINVVDNQIMSPTHTLDVARAVKTILDTGFSDYGVFHCSGTGECSWYQFACEILACLGLKTNIRPICAKQHQSAVLRPAYSVLDTAKIEKIFPPKHWREALAEYLKLKRYIT